jgi:hypothetical protein
MPPMQAIGGAVAGAGGVGLVYNLNPRFSEAPFLDRPARAERDVARTPGTT